MNEVQELQQQSSRLHGLHRTIIQGAVCRPEERGTTKGDAVTQTTVTRWSWARDETWRDSSSAIKPRPRKSNMPIHQLHTSRKIWRFHGGDYEECRLPRYNNPVRTSQETHYVSATDTSRLMLCKIWGFNGGDYEECRLLGYNNPVHNPQETHSVSVREPSRLMLCKIWGFPGGDYEECSLLGYKTQFLPHRNITSPLQSSAG
jgi:hypothetical protein